MQGCSQHNDLYPPRWVSIGLLVLLALWLLIELKEIVSLLVIGYSISYIIDPILTYLESKGVRRTVGVILIGGSLLLFFVLLALTAIPTIIEQFSLLATNLNSYVGQAKEKLTLLVERVNLPVEQLTLRELIQDVPTPNGETIRGVFSAVGSALLSGYSITLTLVNFALLPFIVFYLSEGFSGLHRNFVELFPYAHRDRLVRLGLEIDHYISAFVRGQLLVGTILMVLYAIGLGWLVGIDLWFLIAVVAGLGNIVPYLGFLVGIVLATIMALVTYGDLAHLLGTWAVFAVVQFLEGFFITPRIVGGSVGLSPLVVIIALFAGGQLGGILGLFLAIPVTAGLGVVIREIHGSWIQSGDKSAV